MSSYLDHFGDRKWRREFKAASSTPSRINRPTWSGKSEANVCSEDSSIAHSIIP